MQAYKKDYRPSSKMRVASCDLLSEWGWKMMNKKLRSVAGGFDKEIF